MTKIELSEFNLMHYLIDQIIQSDDDHFQALQTYYPETKKDDWHLWQANQRVQIIKRNADKNSILKLNTKVIATADGNITNPLS